MKIQYKNPLASIFSSFSRSEFFHHYENNEPLIGHNLNELLSPIFNLSFLNSLENLFEIWPTEVTAYLPGISDEVNSKKVSSCEAKKLYAKGRGIYFDDPHQLSPLIFDWLEAFKRDLGLPSITYAQSLIYAIPKGKGTDPHFDPNINFVLQISGEKKWWIAKNEHLPNPLGRHTIGTPMSPELLSYANKEMPTSFPENSKEYLLRPGSMLFLPRGAWHKTLALEDSLSLNFTYSPPTWLDILTMAMRSELAKDPHWRETANYISDSERLPQALKKFEQLLLDLSLDKKKWQAKEIIERVESFENDSL